MEMGSANTTPWSSDGEQRTAPPSSGADAPPPPPNVPGDPPPPPNGATPPNAPTPPNGHALYRPPPARQRWTSGRIAALVVGIVLVVGIGIVVASIVFLGLSQESIDTSVPPDAAIGECFERFESSQQPVSCDSFHHYEVYSAIYFPIDAEYPGRFERLLGADVCEEDFEVYTGQNYFTSTLDYSIPYPSEAEWNDGERATVCVLHHAELKPLRGSKAVGG